MQYVGQTGRSLKTGFREDFGKMKKPKKLTHFFIAISKIMVIYLVKLYLSRLKKLYMIQFIN